MSDTFVMMSQLQSRLRALTHESLKQIRRGIEKESLRVRADGSLATTPHAAQSVIVDAMVSTRQTVRDPGGAMPGIDVNGQHLNYHDSGGGKGDQSPHDPSPSLSPPATRPRNSMFHELAFSIGASNELADWLSGGH